ncbi:MAG: hypothetical protein R3D80_03110 [Paracoccaceae bacterium]
MTAFVGVLQVMTYQQAQVAGGQSFIFNSIMCVVIGGVLLTGGAGSVIGILLRTMTFAVVSRASSSPGSIRTSSSSSSTRCCLPPSSPTTDRASP